MILALYGITRNSSLKDKQTVKITFRPHEIQVATLLLLLSIANNKNQSIENRMAQVGTG